MLTPSPGSTTRRGIFAAGAALLASSSLARAESDSGPAWLKYQSRLSARLSDAGGGEFDADLEKGLLAETNRFRSAQGLGQLAWDEGLAACARAHIADMIVRGYFAHKSPEGFGHADRVALLCRDLCGQTAENLARRDYPSERTFPHHFETMWENSPGHRQNLLNAAFGQAGYGVVRIGGTVYAAGIYADIAVRLSHAMPLTLKNDADLALAIAGAAPSIERLSLTAPFQRATWMAAPVEQLPPLKPGFWQLRPLRPVSGPTYAVLPGPLFQVG